MSIDGQSTMMATVNVRNVRMLSVNRRREIRRRSLVQANRSDLGRQLRP